MSSELSAVVARLESVTSRLEGLAKGKALVEEFSGCEATRLNCYCVRQIWVLDQVKIMAIYL